MDEAGQNSSEREIQELERMLEEKRRTLSERGVPEKEIKEVFREVYKENYASPQEVPSITFPQNTQVQPVKDAAAQKRQDELKKREREEHLAALVQVAFEKGIKEAVNMAKKSTPWLIDELHDRLIDEYYQKLVQAQKI